MMLPVCGNYLLSSTKLCFYFHFSVVVCFSLLTIAYSRKSNYSRRRFYLLTLLIASFFTFFADATMLQMFQTSISKYILTDSVIFQLSTRVHACQYRLCYLGVFCATHPSPCVPDHVTFLRQPERPF